MAGKIIFEFSSTPYMTFVIDQFRYVVLEDGSFCSGSVNLPEFEEDYSFHDTVKLDYEKTLLFKSVFLKDKIIEIISKYKSDLEQVPKILRNNDIMDGADYFLRLEDLVFHGPNMLGQVPYKAKESILLSETNEKGLELVTKVFYEIQELIIQHVEFEGKKSEIKMLQRIGEPILLLDHKLRRHYRSLP